jgi:hypothetical protein
MTIHCYTSATFAYLDRVRVLGETLKRHHPDWVFTLCLSDIEPPGFVFDIDNEPIDRLVRIGDMGFSNLSGWMFEHNIVELCTAVKGRMMCMLLDQGAEKIVYLDPDIALFTPLTELPGLLDQHDIVLTPHLLDPLSKKKAIEADEIAALQHGIYNLGFVAIANHGSGIAFARWWRDRLADYCFDDIPRGLFTDQRWCDLVPALFDNVHILRHRGYNVASWNIAGRKIVIEDDGSITAQGDELRFFHFTKVTSVGGAALAETEGTTFAVLEIMKWYRDRLAFHAPDGLPPRWWAFNHFHDGTRIKPEHRMLFRKNEDLKASLPDPFASTAAEFDALLALAQAGAEAA